MQHDLRLERPDSGGQRGRLADIQDMAVDHGGDSRRLEQARLTSGRRQRHGADLSAQAVQPQGEPAALESRVPRQEDTFSTPEAGCIGAHQTLHGAFPCAGRPSDRPCGPGSRAAPFPRKCGPLRSGEAPPGTTQRSHR
ncbi:hypothetical protein G6F57_021269 [Rhizopus arrhizus]|nr:hypothetical protein G6F57_021269 [Rhizopus arrhizus]